LGRSVSDCGKTAEHIWHVEGGKENRRIVAAFERIFGATIFFATESRYEGASLVHLRRFNFLEQAKIWYTGSLSSKDLQNSITLSDEFFEEVTAHLLPVDICAEQVFASAPGLLDLCLWLSYRCLVAKRPESMPIFGPCGLANQLGSSEYSLASRFRAINEQWLALIRGLWP